MAPLTPGDSIPQVVASNLDPFREQKNYFLPKASHLPPEDARMLLDVSLTSQRTGGSPQSILIRFDEQIEDFFYKELL